MNHKKRSLFAAGIGILGAVIISTACQNSMTKPLSTTEVLNRAIVFKDIVMQDTTAEISIADDSTWNTYYDGNLKPELLKGVFLKGRKIRLSPFALAQYEVTQELYETVMGHNPSSFKTNNKHRPVENVNWYDAIVFCNKLSLLRGLKPYYTIKDKNIDWDAIQYDEIPDETMVEWDNVICDKTSNGFRLPTEAEWEFAARGGDIQNAAWKFAFSGTQCAELAPAQFALYTEDNNLNKYGWYSGNSERKTHTVGTRKPNRLGLYDMSGNVTEWCYDWSITVEITDNWEDNPQGGARPNITDPARMVRGGSFYEPAHDCAVSRLNWYYPHRRANYIGLRLARSLTPQ